MRSLTDIVRRRPAAIGLILILAEVAAPTLCTAATEGVATGPQPAKRWEATPHFTAYSERGGAVRSAPDGVGLFATARDRAVDLQSMDQLQDGPSGSLFNQAAGIGWKNHNMSAMVGYMKPSSVKSATRFQSDDYAPRFKTSARLGVGWSLHF